MFTHSRTLAAAAITALLVAACGGGDDPTGTLNLAVTDAPVDGATAVVVTFTGVELQPRDGERVDVTYDVPRQIDLLALQGGLAAPLLEGITVPAGEYNWIRLKIAADEGTNESFVQLEDGSIHSLRIPSGSESGLKLHGGVTVPAGGAASFTVDFDLRKSLHDPQGGSSDYLLRPTLRLVDDLVVGGIAGTVAAGLLVEGCTPAVYAYAGAGVTPDDVGGSGAQPVSSAQVLTDSVSGVSSYAIGFLAAGDYTVAFTCQATLDAPEADDAIAFAPVQPALVVADAVTTVDFAAPP